MEMNKFIFISKEGFTYQPNADAILPDITNLQVIGFSQGKTAKIAFKNLLSQNAYLKETNFNEIISYELSDKADENKHYHFIQ